MNYIKTIYELIGSEDIPSPHKEDFLKLLNNYQSALRKRESMRDALNSFTDFFKRKPFLEDISFRFFYEKQDDYFYIKEVDFTASNSIENKALFIKEIETFIYIYFEPDIHYYFTALTAKNPNKNVFVNRHLNEEFFSELLTEEEKEAFNRINFFEKNEIEKSVASTGQFKPTHKI